MKQICIVFILIISIIACKDTNNGDEIEMKAGYSYYRVTNKTADTVRFFVKAESVGKIVDLNLRPKEVYIFDLSTLYSGYIICNTGQNYIFKPTYRYDVLDRVLQEIEIHKRD